MLFRFNQDCDEYEVLLGKRSIRRGYGKWAIPGGGKESFDSDFYACACRELREETGVEISDLKAENLAEVCTDIPYFHWRTFIVLTSGDFPAFKPREFSELRWFPISQMGQIDLWINLKRELKVFDRICK